MFLKNKHAGWLSVKLTTRLTPSSHRQIDKKNQVLLEGGDAHGRTALMLAAERFHTETVCAYDVDEQQFLTQNDELDELFFKF